MKPVLQVLSQSEIELIHQSALRILSEIGFRFPFDEALELLKKAGVAAAAIRSAQSPAPLKLWYSKKINTDFYLEHVNYYSLM